MNISRRLIVFVLFLITLLTGMLFWPFILNEIIRPISLVIWVLLRIFVLSVDQNYYWVAVILVTAFFLYRHLLPSPQLTVSYETVQNPNATMGSIRYWHSLLIVGAQNIQDDRTLKKELAHLLLLLYATKKRTSANFQLYEALQQGEIPLPEHIHRFLFPKEPQKPEGAIKKFLQSVQKAPQKWLRRWTGQEKAEYYQMIDEVLYFIETSLEMKDDDGKLNPNKH